MDKLLLMLQLQVKLNESTNGENWISGTTNTGKTINWKRCIYMECAEIVDTFTWKHWKDINKKPDFNNLQIEVVDIWHFIISLALEHYDKEMMGGVEDLSINLANLQSFKIIETQNNKFETQDNIIDKVEDIMFLTLNKSELKLEKLLKYFFELVLMSGLNLNSLYRLYIGKNILNQFRQDNGYKDGTYIKIWGKDEDNVVMKKMWEEHRSIKPDELYKKLTQYYLAYTKK